MRQKQRTKQYPVVIRAQGMFPGGVGGFEAHGEREGGDLGHIVKARSKHNKRLIGDADWAAKLLAEVRAMRAANFALELERLRRRKRKAEIARRLAEGPREPWRKTRCGPMRELIITANSEFFLEAGDEAAIREREDAFGALAKDFLEATFGEDVVYARADRDETAYHVHAIILPRVKTKDGRLMLQPSKFAEIKRYELLQDRAGEWFAQIGLRRGDRNVAARRTARRKGEPLPEKPHHTAPRVWRLQEEQRLKEMRAELEAREAEVRSREASVDDICDVMHGLADGSLDIGGETEAPALKASPDAKAEVKDLVGRTFFASKTFRSMLTSLGKGWRRLRKAAQTEADARLARERDEVRQADDAIVEIVQTLPPKAQTRIAAIRTPVARILTRWRQGRDAPRATPEPTSTPSNSEKNDF